MFDWIDVLFDLAFEGIATLFDFRGRRVEKRAKAANSYLLKNYEETIKPKKKAMTLLRNPKSITRKRLRMRDRNQNLSTSSVRDFQPGRKNTRLNKTRRSPTENRNRKSNPRPTKKNLNGIMKK